MNKYLLLRDNKQSGPFTVDELVAKGIKAYDLVWLDGKSAAWRYPSEIEELKPFAPVIEEQPFDRFYKKPSTTASVLPGEHAENKLPISEPTPAMETVLNKPIVTEHFPKIRDMKVKKIYVNFPSNSRISTPASRIENKEVIHDEFSTGITQDNKIINAARADEQIADYSPSTIPVQENDKAETKMPEIHDRKYSVDPLPKEKTSIQTILIRGSIAACLLLGGIIIGLTINHKSPVKDIKDLNAIVHEIQQKQKPIVSTQPSNTASILDTSSITAHVAVHPLSEKERVNESGKDTFSNKSARAGMKKDALQRKKEKELLNIPLSAENKIIETSTIHSSEGSSTKQPEISKELARKNLLQLISLKNSKYKTGLLGGISGLQLILENRSLYQLDKVEVEIDYLSPENKIVKSQTVYFEKVPPGDQSTINVPKSNRGVSVDYTIKKVNSVELGIAQSAF